MPLFDDAVPKEMALEETLVQLADQYGPDSFKSMLQRLLPSDSIDFTKRCDEVSLDDAVLHYFASDTYQSLATSSQQAYQYEMDLFLRHCRKLKGGTPFLREVTSAVFLTEYLAPVRKLNTRSKKAAFLRSFLGEVFAHFFNAISVNLNGPFQLKSTGIVNLARSQKNKWMNSFAMSGWDAKLTGISPFYGPFLDPVFG